jgi:hypothetical protein
MRKSDFFRFPPSPQDARLRIERGLPCDRQTTSPLSYATPLYNCIVYCTVLLYLVIMLFNFLCLARILKINLVLDLKF